MINKDHLTVSNNFQFAKFLSILMVVTYHFFLEWHVLWIPVAMAMFVFGFASAYFTSYKYQGTFLVKSYWKQKIIRLGYNLLTINLFLLTIFLLKQQRGLLTWQTVFHLLGLTGFLNWFNVANPSPFGGGGLWFFTLLLLFYLFFPIIKSLNKHKLFSYFLISILAILCLYLSYKVDVGHVLWMTTFGFFLGVFVQRNNINFPLPYSLSFLLVVLSLMIIFNFWFHKTVYIFIWVLGLCVATVFIIMNVKIPEQLTVRSSLFSSCLLEIYFIHTYVFMLVTPSKYINYFLSIISILFFAKLLERITLFIKNFSQIY